MLGRVYNESISLLYGISPLCRTLVFATAYCLCRKVDVNKSYLKISASQKLAVLLFR